MAGHLIDLDQAGERLVVSQGPTALYKGATYAGPALLVAALLSYDVLFAGPMQFLGIALVGALCLAMAALVRGWSTTEYRFDRVAGLLLVARTGPVRMRRTRQVPLASVAALVDRRSADERAIELILADRSALVLARARGTGSSALDGVARRVSDVVGKPIQLGKGVLIADRFEIDRLVQRGGMGVVYRALDRTTGQPVALKLILAPSPEGERATRFAREIELLAALDHPRIAKHVAHGITSDGQAFLAMQWLDGEDLSVVLAEGPMSLADSLNVLVGAAEAVAAVHEKGIIHRDLKPSNLFLRDGSSADLVLLDFGVARRLEGDTRLTGSAALVGTPHYMAPEQASSARDMLPAADIFALGCIFYECLTGRHPFDAPQLAGVLARILFDVPEPVTTLRPPIPDAWAALLTRMLAKRPAGRPADAMALLRELRALPAASGASTKSSAAPPAALEQDSGDQVLVCVILATAPAAGAPEQERQRIESLQSALDRFGCPLERLADGSLLATIFPQHSATDLVRVAARCALYLREQMPEARIAVATGRAPLRRSPHVGDAVDKAAQLLETAFSTTPERIRLDTVTARLLGDRFVTAAHGELAVLVGEKHDADDTRLLLGKPTPCVGRDVELLQLEGLASSAIEEAAPRAAVVVGPAGIGKSRLSHEFLRRMRERYPASVSLVGYGDPLSAGSPYVLLSDALRRNAGIRVGDEPERARAAIVEKLGRHLEPSSVKRVTEFLGELAGVPFPDEKSPPLVAARRDHRVMSEQIALAFADWLAAECAAHPVILVLEDVQWGDALTVKLLESALRDLKRGALFVIAVGRPEAYDTFPNLLGAQRALAISLRPLSDKASETLIIDVLGDVVGKDPLARIVRLAAGNALFLEELIRAAAEGKAGDVPETVVAMLQARLSRLPSDARLVLRAASILGETFWNGGVRRIAAAWGSAGDTDVWLAHLVEAELIEPLRISRFLGENEYAFRHALVCEAALGLLTEADRAAGHLAGAAWLDAVGETDAIVLARHAEQGGDRTGAVSRYAQAARQSLEQYDFGQALARMAKGVELGAEGDILGVLRGIEAVALYNQGQWRDAARAGLAAIELVPRGGTLWCSTVETLMQVLPNVGDFKRTEELSDELLRVIPAEDAETAYVRAVSSQLLGYAISGARARGQACLDFIDQLGVAVTERDVVARGYSRMWRSIFTFIVGNDMSVALTLIEQATRDLDEAQIMYRLSLAHTIQAFTFWGLGELEKSEHAARQGMAIAEKIHDDYHVSVAAWYLALTLTEQTDPAKLDEAERCAVVMMELEPNPLFAATSLNVVARVAVARQDWARAEKDGRAARDGLLVIAPYRFFATASLLRALVAQGKGVEAAAIAREDLALLAKIGSPLCSEALLLVAAAEALFAGGDPVGADGTLREALRHIELRVARIPEPHLKASFLERRAENRRARELAKAWLGVPAS